LKTEKWPEYDGHVIVDGRKFYLSVWVRTAEKTGKKFFSLALKPAEEKIGAAARALAAGSGTPDGDIPF
jgi:hypothetical protein